MVRAVCIVQQRGMRGGTAVGHRGEAKEAREVPCSGPSRTWVWWPRMEAMTSTRRDLVSEDREQWVNPMLRLAALVPGGPEMAMRAASEGGERNVVRMPMVPMAMGWRPCRAMHALSPIDRGGMQRCLGLGLSPMIQSATARLS